jgi:protein subunit release factor A
MESVIIEIRSGEGGDDAKLLVKDQFGIYVKLMDRRGL